MELPLVPRLLECMDDAQGPLLFGAITYEGEIKGSLVRNAMQLRADSFLAGVLRPPELLAGPLPWQEPMRTTAIRHRMDEIPLCRMGVADAREGRFYFLTGGCTTRVKNLGVERCAAGLLLVPPRLEKALTDDFMEHLAELRRHRGAMGQMERLAELRRHRGAMGQRRQRTPSPASSDGSWCSGWDVISERGAPPRGGVPSNPTPGMRQLLAETGDAPRPGAVPSNPTAGMRQLLAGHPGPGHGTSLVRRRGLAARGFTEYRGDPGPAPRTDDVPEPEPDPVPGFPDGAIYCSVCEMWTNGAEQYENHLLGRKHRRQTAATLREQEARRARWRRGLQCVVVSLALLVGLCCLCWGASETAGMVALQMERLVCGLLVAFCLVMAWVACRAGRGPPASNWKGSPSLPRRASQ